MERILEGITGLEASNIIYSNDTYLRTLNTDAQFSAADGVRANIPKGLGAILPNTGYSPIDAVMSPTYHPIIRIVTNIGGAADLLAVRGAAVLNTVEVTLLAGETFIDSKILGDYDARIYVVFKEARLTYNNSPVYACFEYNLATGEVLTQPYDIGVYIVALENPTFPNNAQAYPEAPQRYTTFNADAGLAGYAFGYNKVFLNYSDIEALELFAMVNGAIDICYVRVSDSAVFKLLNVNVKAGYNKIGLLDWLDLNAIVDPFYLMVVFTNGAVSFAVDDIATGIQKDVIENSAVSVSGILPSFRLILKGVQGLSENSKRGTFIPSGATSTFGYYYVECAINSAKRLKALNVYAMSAGVVYIDFYAPDSEGYAAVSGGFANYTLEGYAVKKGWNHISNINVPNFIGTAYVCVRADAGVLAFQAAPSGLQVFERNGGSAPVSAPYRFLYNIETYDFDFSAVVTGCGNLQLPSGTIEFSTPITLRNVHLTGQGIENTWLRYTGASQFAVTLVKGGLSDLTVIGQSTIKASVPTLFATLAEVQNLTGLNAAGTSGVKIQTSPSSISRVKIKDFDYAGFQNAATPVSTSGRDVHNLIGQIDVTGCGIGLDILQAGEYSPMALAHASNCGIGIRIGAGNVFTSASTYNDNAVGLYMYKTGNDAHGSFTACNWNHSKKWAIILDTISHGETFVGCHVFEGPIYLYRSIGFNWTGGIIDAPIMAQGGKTQSLSYTTFQSAYWNKAGGILHNYNGETDYLKMHGNFFMFETGADDGILNNV